MTACFYAAVVLENTKGNKGLNDYSYL